VASEIRALYNLLRDTTNEIQIAPSHDAALLGSSSRRASFARDLVEKSGSAMKSGDEPALGARFMVDRIEIEKIEIKKKEALPRAVCLLGAVVDGLVLPPMLIPSLGASLFGLGGFFPGADYRYAMNIAASLMLGWTLLLLWAARRPIERNGVLALTAIVVACLTLAGVGAVLSGFVSLGNMLPVLVLQSGLSLLFLAAYLRANRLRSWAGSMTC
jgi:hypothetical protein